MALLLGLFLALGLVFRAGWLDASVLWHDEVATRIFASGFTPDVWREHLFTGEVFPVAEVLKFQTYDPSRSLSETVWGLVTDDPQHPPLYYTLMRLWAGLFGVSVAALRTPSVLASIALVPAMYWLAQELYEDERVSRAAAALTVVSPFFVLYAQEAREYALWSLLIVLSTAALLQAWRSGRWATYTVLCTLSLYTSFSSVAFLAAHGGAMLWRARDKGWRDLVPGVVSLGITGTLFLPWAIALVRNFEAFQVSMRWSKEIIIPTSSLLRIVGHNASRTVVDVGPELDGLLAWTAMFTAVALFAGAVIHHFRTAPSRALVLLALLIAIPIGLMLGPDLLFGGIRSVSARYMTPAWIGLLLVTAAWLATDPQRQKVLAGVVIVGTLSCMNNLGRDAVWTKGVSMSLPAVSAAIDGSPSPLIIGDNERTHPGNLMALAARLPADAHMQFLTIEMGDSYRIPPGHESVFIFGSIPQFRERLQQVENVDVTLVVEDLHVQFWKVTPR